MHHSNRKIENELAIAQQNKEYVEAKRAESRHLSADHHLTEPRPKSRSRIYCCIALALVLGFCAYIIYFFATNIKSDVVNEYHDKKEQINSALPQTKNELATSIDQGEQLYNETQNSIQRLQDKFNQARKIYDTISGWYDKMNNIFNK